MAPGEFARRGDERRVIDADRGAGALQPTHEFVVLHQRQRRDAADRLIDPAADEDAAITVIEREAPEPGVEAGEPAGKAAVAVEHDAEIAAGYGGIAIEQTGKCAEPARGKDAVGMEEEQDLARGRGGAGTQLTPAARRGLDDTRAEFGGQRGRPVGAAAIGDD